MQEKVEKYIYFVSDDRYRVKFLKVDKAKNKRINFNLKKKPQQKRKKPNLKKKENLL